MCSLSKNRVQEEQNVWEAIAGAKHCKLLLLCGAVSSSFGLAQLLGHCTRKAEELADFGVCSEILLAVRDTTQCSS